MSDHRPLLPQQLAAGAGTPADTLHKLVYEHHTKWIEHRQPPDPAWWLRAGSVVIIDEAGMVDTRLLHEYAQIAQRNHWRTILVGDHRQLDPVDAGGMFAELVEHPDVLTVELDTLHRFEHQWEADASLLLRDGDVAAVEVYDRHGRIHGHTDEQAAVDAVVDAAFAGTVEGRDVLVMAPTNRVVDQINHTMTDRLLAAGLARPGRQDQHRRTSLLHRPARRHQSQRPHDSPTDPTTNSGYATATAGPCSPGRETSCTSSTETPATVKRFRPTTSRRAM